MVGDQEELPIIDPGLLAHSDEGQHEQRRNPRPIAKFRPRLRYIEPIIMSIKMVIGANINAIKNMFRL